jgi:hypothetical protein
MVYNFWKHKYLEVGLCKLRLFIAFILFKYKLVFHISYLLQKNIIVEIINSDANGKICGPLLQSRNELLLLQ